MGKSNIERSRMSMSSAKVRSNYQKIVILFLQKKGKFRGTIHEFSNLVSEFCRINNVSIKLERDLVSNFSYNIRKLEFRGFITYSKVDHGIHEITITDVGRNWTLESSTEKRSETKTSKFDDLIKDFGIPGMTMADVEIIQKVLIGVRPYVEELESKLASQEEEIAFAHKENNRMEEDLNKTHEMLTRAELEVEVATKEARCHSCDQIKEEAQRKVEEAKEDAERVKREARREVVAAAEKYKVHVRDAQSKVLAGDTSVHGTSRN